MPQSQPHPADKALAELLDWANERYAQEVDSRADTNLLKPTLKTTWGKVVRKLESAVRRRRRELENGQQRAAREAELRRLLKETRRHP